MNLIRPNLPFMLACVILLIPAVNGYYGPSTALSLIIGLSVVCWLLAKLIDRFTSPTCDAPDCFDNATVHISDESAFCADHAGQFYAAVEEGSA